MGNNTQGRHYATSWNEQGIALSSLSKRTIAIHPNTKLWLGATFPYLIHLDGAARTIRNF
jgi:hypothetical protein